MKKNMVSPHYILSFTECDSAPRNWGGHRLKLFDVEKFVERIRVCMHRCTVIFDKVKYSDESGYERIPTGPEMWRRASLTKPTYHAKEREWRLILVLNQLKIINDPLKIDVGVLSGVLDFCPASVCSVGPGLKRRSTG
jgi:hypothetical protein